MNTAQLLLSVDAVLMSGLMLVHLWRWRKLAAVLRSHARALQSTAAFALELERQIKELERET